MMAGLKGNKLHVLNNHALCNWLQVVEGEKFSEFFLTDLKKHAYMPVGFEGNVLKFIVFTIGQNSVEKKRVLFFRNPKI